ncbi:MAG: hypothetical protein WD572_06030 [Gammaproteobacteria bacterium]
MKTLKIVLAALVFLVSSFTTSAPAEAGSDSLPEMVVYHDPNCGCCGKWMAYMREAGFVVRSETASDMAAVQAAIQRSGFTALMPYRGGGWLCHRGAHTGVRRQTSAG